MFHILLAAQNPNVWHKVESPKKEESSKKGPKPHQFDSLEDKFKFQKPRPQRLWPLNPRLNLSGGLQLEGDDSAPDQFGLLNGRIGVVFNTQANRRFAGGVALIQNREAMLNFDIQFTPSRTFSRFFYGFGIAHQLTADKELSNLLELENYFVTGLLGWEILLTKTQGVFFSTRGMASTGNQIVELNLGYTFKL